ncbi:MAG: hypothetical protein ACHQ5A_12745, partial [Opitutales bacterium]
FWPVLAGSAVWFALRPHGDVSHHESGEIFGLGLMLAMVPVVIAHLGSFQWPVAAERWWRAAAAWWIILVASGWIIFLPGVSEAVKFTHVLVAHSHLAMAGLVSSVGGALLAALGCAPGRASAGFWWWQLGCLAHVLVLLAIGMLESGNPSWLWSGGAVVTFLFAARLATGLILLGVSVHWLGKECR